jgi:hypothetical protein
MSKDKCVTIFAKQTIKTGHSGCNTFNFTSTTSMYNDERIFLCVMRVSGLKKNICSALFNPLTPELNPSAQRCLKRFFTGDFAS